MKACTDYAKPLLIARRSNVPRRIEGSVTSVSESGNLVTDITADQLTETPTGESTVVRCDEHVTNGIFPADHDQPDFTLIALIGDSGCLELVIVGDSASNGAGTSVADALRVYAAEMRDKRVMRAEEKANKLPTKMTLATMTLTVPPLLIILIGPSVLGIMDLFAMGVGGG